MRLNAIPMPVAIQRTRVTTEAIKDVHGTHLDINAGDVTSTKELYVMLILVDWIVVNACIFARVPVKDKLTIVQTTHSLLPTKYAQIALLQL